MIAAGFWVGADMNRRTLLGVATAFGLAGIGPFRTQIGRAQDASPVPAGSGIQLIRWELQLITSNTETVTPDDPAKYWIQLFLDGSAGVRADCNQAFGSYTLDGSSLMVKANAMTMVLCDEGSISDRFLHDLSLVVSYVLTTNASDELILEMAADSGQLTFAPALTGVVWEWTEFQGDVSVVTASDPSRYTVEFLDGGGMQVQADCNKGLGEAKIDGSSIDLTVATTRMACPEGSQDSDFLRYVNDAVSYVIRDGMLALSLPADAGIALFRPTIPLAERATPESGG
jgi:heat shock protein HslJ